MVLSLGKRELITAAPSAKEQPRSKGLHSLQHSTAICAIFQDLPPLLVTSNFDFWALHFTSLCRYLEQNTINIDLPSFPSCGLMMIGDVQFCCCCQYSCTQRQQSGKRQKQTAPMSMSRYLTKTLLAVGPSLGAWPVVTVCHCACFLPSTFFNCQHHPTCSTFRRGQQNYGFVLCSHLLWEMPVILAVSSSAHLMNA